MSGRRTLSISIIACCLVLAITSVSSADYELKWQVDGGGGYIHMIGNVTSDDPLFIDFNGDSNADILCYVDSIFTVIDGMDGSILYSLVGLNMYSSCCLEGIGNTDPDPSFEVLVSFSGWGEFSSSPDTLRLLDIQTGNTLWTYVSANSDSRLYDSSLRDVDGDGKDEILFVEGNVLYCFQYGPDAVSPNDPGDGSVPRSFALDQNYPNPFNPSTTIQYELTTRCQVVITIYNVNGQLVDVLVNEEESAGIHQVLWEGLNSDSEKVATGVYFYRLEAGDYISSKKMLLLK